MFRKAAVAALVALVVTPAVGWADEGFGGGTRSDVVTSGESEFSSLGQMVASIDAAAPEEVVGGSGGTFAFPINITVYGRQHLRIPTDPADWDEYCFIVSYSTAHVDEVEDKQLAARGVYELQEDRLYLEPAETAHRLAVDAWEAEVARREAENEEREAAGEPLLPIPSRPEEPTFPVEVCEGEPGEVPDFTPAFDAAAELIRSIDLASPYIAPGRGIAGLDAYLETRRPMAVTQEERSFPDLGDDYSADPANPSPIPGTVSFRGEGTYMVDWGDGVVEGPFTDPGVPYGDGSGPAITHAYVDTGDYTITVTDSWRVSMDVTFLGETFTFTHQRELEPQTWPFSVGEVRSVRED